MSASDGVLLIDLDDTLIDRQAGFRLWATRFLPQALSWLVPRSRATSRSDIQADLATVVAKAWRT